MKYIFAILTNTFHNLDKYILLFCGTLTTRQRVEWAKVNTRCVFLPGMKQTNNERKQATQKVFTVFFISSLGDETDKQQTEQSTQERCLLFFPKSPLCFTLKWNAHKQRKHTKKQPWGFLLPIFLLLLTSQTHVTQDIRGVFTGIPSWSIACSLLLDPSKQAMQYFLPPYFINQRICSASQ